jgi:Flp pilus assembly pilin Flp
MLAALQDRVLLVQLVVLEAIVAARGRLRAAAARPLRNQRGQTPTEYLMIVGLMAAVIIIAFSVYFWPTIKKSAQSWSKVVSDAIVGKQITK